MNPENQAQSVAPQSVATPTNQPVIEDVGSSTVDHIKKYDKKYLVFYSILFVATLAVIIFEGWSIYFISLPVAIAIAGYIHVESKIRKQFIQQLGDSIGFTYSPSADMSTVNGRMFREGHDQNIRDVLSGNRDGRASRIFTYGFTIGYGKGSHTYSLTVFETTFANVMPDITLEYTFGGPSLTFAPKDTERIRLEGDFNKYFTLEVPKGYEVEAYQILTPDVMANLIDKAHNMSFEFCGNKLYIFAGMAISSRTEFEKMYALVNFLDGLFSKNTADMKAYTPADLSVNSGN